MIKYKVVQLCQQDAVSIIPIERITLDLEKIAKGLISMGYTTEDQGIMVTASKNNLEISIYKNGRILINGSTSKDIPEIIGNDIYSCNEA